MNNLAKRSLTSVLFVVVLLGSIVQSELSSSILFFIIILLCQNEFYNFFKSSEIKPQKWLGIVIGLSLFSISSLSRQANLDLNLLALIIPLLFLVFIVELYRKHTQPIGNIAYTFLGVLYVALPFTLLHSIAYYRETAFTSDYGFEVLIGYFFILWANDTGAYFVGRSLGKHKLFERISPKKTWEGSFGGAFFGLVVGYANYLLFPALDLWVWLGMAFIIVVFGSIGDLVESLFKRSLKIKDSGNILPGHGGVLDRFDGIFISAPMVYTFLKLLSLWGA